MAEIVRNVVLAAVAVTATHFAILISEQSSAVEGGFPKRVTLGGSVGEPIGGGTLRGPTGTSRAEIEPSQERFFDDRVNEPLPSQDGGMPMDGLREMFEFASARGSWGKQCDRPEGGMEASAPCKPSKSVYPEQISGPHMVVNTCEDEGLVNGGSSVGDGGVAAFDGWGDVASFEECQ